MPPDPLATSKPLPAAQTGLFNHRIKAQVAAVVPFPVWAGLTMPLLDSHSNTFNPFAIGNADAIRDLIASQLGDNPVDVPGVGVIETEGPQERVVRDIGRYLDELPGYDPAASMPAASAARAVHGYALSTIRRSGG